MIGALIPAPRVLTVPLAVLLGGRIRRLAAARADARRRRAMDAEIPQLLDLLAAGSAAGLSAVAGLRRSVSVLRGPLGAELRASLDAVDLGARWREEIAAVTERLGLPDLRRAVVVLTRTETLGTSLTDATQELAAEVRRSRGAAVAERARAAPVKMLFPLVFLVLPAFLLLTVVPVLLTTVQSIR
jgi:tight adherence protein C